MTLTLIKQYIFAVSGALRRSSLEKRRLSLGGGVSGHRGSEPSLDPNHAAILFRDSRGVSIGLCIILYNIRPRHHSLYEAFMKTRYLYVMTVCLLIFALVRIVVGLEQVFENCKSPA